MKYLKLVAVLILLPLCLALFGGWELQRGIDNAQQTREYQTYLTEILPQIKALHAERGVHWVEMDGQKVATGVALPRLERMAGEMDTLLGIDRVRYLLAIAVVVLSLLAAVVGLAGLLVLKWAATRALRSRDLLLQGFTFVRQRLPYVLVGHVLVTGTAVTTILGFEGLGVWHAGKMSSGEFKLMIAAAVIMFGCLYSLWHVARQLRAMLHMFEPAPLPVLGRCVTPIQAPSLWQFVNALAARIDALPPEHIVVGMNEGFYVTSSDVQLLPGATALTGRTLHVPITYLGLLDSAEISAVIGHELGHFVGEDTEYSLRFVPIYDGIGRSLGSLAAVMDSSDLLQRTIMRPAFILGLHFLESFDHAVSHWSRTRELAADAAGAKLGGNLAAASALVRISAIEPLLIDGLDARIRQAIDPHHQQPISTDLANGLIDELAGKPLSLPAEQMAVQLPHPSDTHPSNGERVEALQVTVDEAVSRGVRPVEPVAARAALAQYFADAHEVCTGLGHDFLDHYAARDAEMLEQLRHDASHVSGEVHLHEGANVRGWITLVVFVLIGLLGVGLLLLPWLLPDKTEKNRELFLITGGLLAGLMLLLLPFSLRLIRRARQTALVLTPDHLVFANLKAPVPVRDIADFSLVIGQGVHLKILLGDHAPLPDVTSSSMFKPGAKLKRKQRVVHLALVQFCRDNVVVKPQELAELIGAYLNAGNARHYLQHRTQQSMQDGEESLNGGQ